MFAEAQEAINRMVKKERETKKLEDELKNFDRELKENLKYLLDKGNLKKARSFAEIIGIGFPFSHEEVQSLYQKYIKSS